MVRTPPHLRGRIEGQHPAAGRGARGVRRSRSLHAITGVWISLGLLVLSATGLTWSAHAGERFTELRTSLSAYAPELDTSASSAEGSSGHGHSGGVLPRAVCRRGSPSTRSLRRPVPDPRSGPSAVRSVRRPHV
ncbi:PepSY-associated TM helix domain-containing protein [Streptomyces sp. NPDC056464]|uniref:PepSY-associated TM helix domain-containing protein n=1 Tax=Streptomyces sp. NPDC056464 TaxID=3345828 RepID=UPI003697A03A